VALKATIFDLDDTLYSDEDMRDRTLLAMAARLPAGANIDPEEFRHTVRWTAREVFYDTPLKEYARRVGISSWEGLWAKFHGEDDEARRMNRLLDEYRRAAWKASLDKLNLGKQLGVAEATAGFVEERRKHHAIFPDVVSCLERLKNSYRLAMLTNGAVDLQREKIAGCGLAPYFEVITISGEIGIGKPDRQVFDLTLERLGLGVDEVIMIGNSLSSDVAGANGVGIRSIWLNRHGMDNDTGIVPDVEIKDLDGLETVL